MENKCENCAYFYELKKAHGLSDGSKIYGYCYAEDTENVEGRAVFQLNGYCDAFRENGQNEKITRWVCWYRRAKGGMALPYFAIEGRNADDRPIRRDFIMYSAHFIKAGLNAVDWLSTHDTIPRFHLKQKTMPGYIKPALWCRGDIEAFDPGEIRSAFLIDAPADLEKWFSTAKVGDHYDGEGFTIDVEEYSIPGWEVRKKEDVEK